MTLSKILFCAASIFSMAFNTIHAQSNVIDEVIAIVGDEPILKSDVERSYQQSLMEGNAYDGDVKCQIFEEMLIQKLLLNQAKLDSIEVSHNEVVSKVDERMNYFINQIGDQQKLEEYFNKSVIQIKRDQMVTVKNLLLTQKMQQNITADIKITPSEVRDFFRITDPDSLPMVPIQYELQQLTIKPPVKQSEVDRIKDLLRGFQKQISEGRDFATLAVLYSEDKESATRGGDVGWATRTTFVPEFANAAFNLQENGKVSKIVETEYGYHIIQLIDRKGDRINVRHILLKPKVSEADKKLAYNLIDSLATLVKTNKLTFNDVALRYSMDKDTRASGGQMVNKQNSSTKFELNDLAPEIIRAVQNLSVGSVSVPVLMKDSKGDFIYNIFMVKQLLPPHRANLNDDYQLLTNLMLDKKREKILNQWVTDKQSATYISIEKSWINCDYKYSGWIK